MTRNLALLAAVLTVVYVLVALSVQGLAESVGAFYLLSLVVLLCAQRVIIGRASA